MLIPALLLVAQIVEASPVTLQPGVEFYWKTPCTVAAADSANRIQYLAEGFLALTPGGPQRVVRCIQPAGETGIVMWSKGFDDGTFLIAYNEEFEEDAFPYDALRGVIAHEVAHIRIGRSCNGPIYRQQTEEEYLSCEAEVDQEAARLVGTAAVASALQEAYKLQVRMMSGVLLKTRRHLMVERIKRLRAAP